MIYFCFVCLLLFQRTSNLLKVLEAAEQKKTLCAEMYRKWVSHIIYLC